MTQTLNDRISTTPELLSGGSAYVSREITALMRGMSTNQLTRLYREAERILNGE